MASNFVTLTKDQFEAILPEDWAIVEDPNMKNIKEIVYEIPTENPVISVRIYSTVDVRTGETRGKGDDAIRVVFWDTKNSKFIGKGKKILRVEKKTSIENRIKSRVAEFLDRATLQQVTDMEYVKGVLDHDAVSWMGFAQSLYEQLIERGSLSEKQLQYVIGETNPKGKLTFEGKVLEKDPSFKEKFLEGGSDNDDKQIESRVEEGDGTGEEEPKVDATDEVLLERRTELGVSRVEEARSVDGLVATKGYGPFEYPFNFFNPIQSETFAYHEEDANLVIGAQTSAGKTIAAELLMDHTLYKEDRIVIYLSPLKALTQEKYDDWQKRFPNEEIVIMTGDYSLSKEMKEKLDRSRIIVMTSEMADSRTRKMHSEKNYWLKRVGLVIVDESHILTTSRGHAVESGIMRFTKINSDARILFLSATMPNVGELGEWLSDLNSKKTNVIYNLWRPVTLQMHYHEYPIVRNQRGWEDYWASQEQKRSTAVDIAMSKPDEKFLIFCHDKGTGRDIVKRLHQIGQKDAVFHNADLNLSERLEVEGKFADRDNGIRVMVSTSTLAWGRNLPARNVIIVGVHRGLNEVDELDIIQMSGRAGRYGIDDEGHVYLIIPEMTTNQWIETFKNPRPVTSVLNNHHTLAFHVIAEIAINEITSVSSLMKWYQRSLSYRQDQMPLATSDAEGLLDDLLRMEMIGLSGDKPFVTGLGKVCAWMYFSPYDVYAWYKNFSKIWPAEKPAQAINMYTDNLIDKQVAFDDITLAWALGDIPSNNMGYVPKDLQFETDDMRWQLKNRGVMASDAIVSAFAVYSCLVGEETKGMLGAMKRGVIFDIARVVQAISLIDGMYAKWNQDALWSVLPARVTYGIPAEMAGLVRLKGVGAVKARKLWDKGVKSLSDVADKGNRKKLLTLFQPTLAKRLAKDAAELMAVN